MVAQCSVGIQRSPSQVLDTSGVGPSDISPADHGIRLQLAVRGSSGCGEPNSW